MAKIRKSVLAFAKIMERKLQRNSHKQGWDGLTLRQCLNRAETELSEFRDAVENGAGPTKIQEEAADVANFMMFMANNASHLDDPIRLAPQHKESE